MASYHYSLRGISLKITCSDSQQEHVDEARISNIKDRPDGQKRQLRLQSNDSLISKDWRKKIATELAIKFLLKPRNSTYMIILSSEPLLMPSLVDYFLAKFPKGYFLYSDEIGGNHVIRYDMYLFSMCSLLSVSHLLLTLSFPNR
jgi:hypothetical protein